MNSFNLVVSINNSNMLEYCGEDNVRIFYRLKV